MRGFGFITTAVYGRLGYHCAQFLQLSTKSGTVVKVRGIPHLAKNERDVGHPGVVERETTASGCSLLPEHCQRRFYKTYGVGHTGMPRGGTGHLRRVIG